MVSVLATAHMHPASTAHTIRCGAWRTSLRTCEVPRTKAGTLQRARKTPNTMMRETVMGEISGLTSLIGASAPPSQAPAAKPQKMPRACSDRKRVADMGPEVVGGTVWMLAEDGFNGAYPGARARPPGRRAESRSGGRLRSRETGLGEQQVRLRVTSPPRDSCWASGVILGIGEAGVNAGRDRRWIFGGGVECGAKGAWACKARTDDQTRLHALTTILERFASVQLCLGELSALVEHISPYSTTP